MTQNIATPGIHGYSSPNTVDILFCADPGMDHELLRRMGLAQIAPLAVGIGVYKGGEPEVVYAVTAQQFVTLTNTGWPGSIAECIRQQESILRLGHLKAMNWREASLVYLNNGEWRSGTYESVGTWLEVTKEEAEQCEGYSVFNGHYFTTQLNPPDCEEERKAREVTQMVFDLRTSLFKQVGGRASKEQGKLLKQSWDMLMGKTLPDGRTITMQVIRDAIDA